MNLFNKFTFLDGGFGTMLVSKGLKAGQLPEEFNIEAPEIVESIHKAYVEAGSDIILTNTFGANKLKMSKSKYPLSDLIKNAVLNAKNASKDTNVKIALDIGPIGELLEPMGKISFEEAVEIFKETITEGVKNGIDIIYFETMSDLYELKAAIIAAKECCDKPIFCTMTFEESMRTFTGCSISSMAVFLENMGVSAIGLNCSLGPSEMLPLAKELIKYTNLPLIIKPNAGLPKLKDGIAVYDIDSDEFSDLMTEYAKLGITIFGGCCGTNPDYIRKTKEKVSKLKPVYREKISFSAVCSPFKTVIIDNVTVIGERINPTGKKLFKKALIENDIDYILKQGYEQRDSGASILDVNVGLPEIDEVSAMKNVVKSIQNVIDLPLQIDSSNSDAIEAGLRIYNGKPIVNSVNGEKAVLETVLPIVKKYGASVVGLTLDENGIPSSCDERIEIAERIINKCIEYGIPKEDIFIDCLTLTASAQQKDVMETLKAVKKITKMGYKTVLGVSNISFGLPNRPLINKTFLTMALQYGLSLPIINPNDKEVMETILAFNVLNATDENAKKYTSYHVQVEENENADTIEYAVLNGNKTRTSQIAKDLLSKYDELTVVNEYLIPCMDVVGKKYENGEIFLPTLIEAAETAKIAFEEVNKSIKSKGQSSKEKNKIILATVKGDVHDIGKNIVKVVLENYGFEIIDLGKDVSSEKIIECIKENNVKLVGLSALMTTTLSNMEQIIKDIKNTFSDVKIMVGGAVLTKDYAKKIYADFYSKDAKGSAEIAKAFFEI